MAVILTLRHPTFILRSEDLVAGGSVVSVLVGELGTLRLLATKFTDTGSSIFLHSGGCDLPTSVGKGEVLSSGVSPWTNKVGI